LKTAWHNGSALLTRTPRLAQRRNWVTSPLILAWTIITSVTSIAGSLLEFPSLLLLLLLPLLLPLLLLLVVVVLLLAWWWWWWWSCQIALLALALAFIAIVASPLLVLLRHSKRKEEGWSNVKARQR
jgi:hypothetical protein